MSAETSRAERVAGVDGCRNGWVVASLAADGALHPRVEMVESFGAVLDLGFAAVGVDMPFQLLEDGPRPDETEARRLLGPRRSSIFPSPIRAVLDCIDYAEALEVSRRLSGRGLSKQAWNLVPKIIEVRDAGGELIVMPHSDHEVIDEAKAEGLICLPGVATPSEGFAALTNGADGLKMFPGEAMPPKIVKAWRAVFPEAIKLLPVGGVSAENIPDYLAAGASGFGIGTSVYAPGRAAADVRKHADALVAACRR